MATSKKPEILRRSESGTFDARAARSAALDTLARRDHCTSELKKKLLDKGFDSKTLESLIKQLLQERLLDDRRYVENFVKFRAERGQGPLRVRRDLNRLGLLKVIVQEAVGAYPNWLVHLEKARQKKFGSEPTTDYADRQRQAQFLGYRGFTGSQIRLALGADVDLDTDLMQTAEDL